MEDDESGGDDPFAYVLYRLAYGEAARIVESHTGSLNDGRDFARKVGTGAAELARDIARRLGVDPDAIREAVEDALDGRRPKW